MRRPRLAVMISLVATVSCASGIASFVLGACGTDVSLGGGGDAQSPIAEAGADATLLDTLDCEPCSTTSACRARSSCASVDGGDAFCFASCDASTQCEPDELCGSATDVAQTPTLACVPKGGACPAAVGPVGPDGSTLDQCGTLVGPKVADAGCTACHHDCQKNGCYGGYYCDVLTKDCSRPPAKCL